MPGAPIVEILKPTKTDYVVLKSTLSGFYQTPLETMLRLGKAYDDECAHSAVLT